MEKRFSLADIMAMPKAHRRDFINTLSGYRSAQLLGTLSYAGVPNLGLFSSVVHVGASPPLLGFVMRPLTVPRQTYHHIRARRFFTLNQVTPAFYRQAHQTAAKYGVDEPEFDAVGLHAYYTDAHPAPYVAESPIKIGLEWVEEHQVQANGALFMVGRVVEVLVQETLLTDGGHVRLEDAPVVGVAGLDTYYVPTPLGRLPYPRPGQEGRVLGQEGEG